MVENEKMSVIIDLKEIKSSKDLQNILMDKLGFPDFYGKNWNAFWDAITGLAEMWNNVKRAQRMYWESMKRILPNAVLKIPSNWVKARIQRIMRSFMQSIKSKIRRQNISIQIASKIRSLHACRADTLVILSVTGRK